MIMTSFKGHHIAHFIKRGLAALILALPTVSMAQNAVNIDATGNVTIPGTLTVGSLQTASMTWVKFADNLREAMDKVALDPIGTTTNYEFMMTRNAGMRILHFSSWNSGLRVMTEPYMTGDSSSAGALYRLGGSMWVLNNEYDPQSSSCTSDKVYHRYYYYSSDGVRAIGGNECRSEATVFVRKRAFQ